MGVDYVRAIFGRSARKIGAGIQGEVWVVNNDAILKRLFEKLQHRTGKLPRTRYVCLKLRVPIFSAEYANNMTRSQWVREEVLEFNSMSTKEVLTVWRQIVRGGHYEYTMLEYAYRPSTSRVPCWFRPKDIFPMPYFEGVDMDCGVHIIAMEFKRGAVLSRALYTPTSSPDLAARVERAVLMMWYAGIVHQDLHDHNMLVDPDTKNVTIIDLGFARVLPPPVVMQLRQKIAPVVNAIRKGEPVDVDSFGNTVWEEIVKPNIVGSSALHNHWVLSFLKTYASRRRDVRSSRMVTARKRAWACSSSSRSSSSF